MDANGLEATSILSKEGIKINMTLVFSANQALLAALAGATYVSPFVGRLDDAGQDGMEVVRHSVADLRPLQPAGPGSGRQHPHGAARDPGGARRLARCDAALCGHSSR